MEKTVEIIIKDGIVRQVKCPEGVIRDYDTWGVNGDQSKKTTMATSTSKLSGSEGHFDGHRPSSHRKSVPNIGESAMLFLAERLLKAAGFEYDQIEETWVVPVPLRPVVTVECDEDGPHVMEALLEVHAVLQANGCTYNNFAINGHYVSIVGLTVAEMADRSVADIGWRRPLALPKGRRHFGHRPSLSKETNNARV